MDGKVSVLNLKKFTSPKLKTYYFNFHHYFYKYNTVCKNK